MLSTMHSQPEIETTSDQKPSIIMFYNKTKGGVNTLDHWFSKESINSHGVEWGSLNNCWGLLVQ